MKTVRLTIWLLVVVLLCPTCCAGQSVFTKHNSNPLFSDPTTVHAQADDEITQEPTPTNKTDTPSLQQWTTLTLTLAIVSTLVVAVACLSFEATNVAHALLFVEQLQLLASLYHLQATHAKVKEFAAGLQWTLFELHEDPVHFGETLTLPEENDVTVHLRHRLTAACIIITSGVFCLAALNAVRELRSPLRRGPLPAATVTSTLLITLWRISTPGLTQAAILTFSLLPSGWGWLGLGVFLGASVPALATLMGALRWLPSSAVYEPLPWLTGKDNGTAILSGSNLSVTLAGTVIENEHDGRGVVTQKLNQPNQNPGCIASFFRPHGRWFSRTLLFVETFGVVFTHLRPCGTAFPLVQFGRLVAAAIAVGVPVTTAAHSNIQLFILAGVTFLLLVYVVWKRPFTRPVDNVVHGIVYLVQVGMLVLLLIAVYNEIDTSAVVNGFGLAVAVIPLIVLVRSALQSTPLLDTAIRPNAKGSKATTRSRWGSRLTKASGMSDVASMRSGPTNPMPTLMFERFKVISRAPLIVEVHDILTPQQCQDLINLARPHLKPSMVDDNGDTYKDRTHRTSRGVNVELMDLDDEGRGLVNDVRDQLYRASEIVASTRGCSFELLDVVRYKATQLFGWHVDYLSPNSEGFRDYGQRFLTSIVYLNTCEKGGQTEFRVGITVKPRMGTALIFSNFTPDGEEDPLTEHRAVPPDDGHEKWIITQWACMSQKEWVRRYGMDGKKNPVYEEAKRLGVVPPESVGLTTDTSMVTDYMTSPRTSDTDDGYSSINMYHHQQHHHATTTPTSLLGPPGLVRGHGHEQPAIPHHIVGHYPSNYPTPTYVPPPNATNGVQTHSNYRRHDDNTTGPPTTTAPTTPSTVATRRPPTVMESGHNQHSHHHHQSRPHHGQSSTTTTTRRVQQSTTTTTRTKGGDKNLSQRSGGFFPNPFQSLFGKKPTTGKQTSNSVSTRQLNPSNVVVGRSKHKHHAPPAPELSDEFTEDDLEVEDVDVELEEEED